MDTNDSDFCIRGLSRLYARLVLIDEYADTTAVCCNVSYPSIVYCEEGKWAVELNSGRLNGLPARTVYGSTPKEAIDKALRITREGGNDIHGKIAEMRNAVKEMEAEESNAL